jgi:hypothetical protein
MRLVGEFESSFNPPLEGGSKNPRGFFGEGVGLDGETYPLPEICFASLANCRPSLKGRVD